MALGESFEEEMARLQKLSNEYQPDVEGPLVGHRASSEALMAEYASADPVYVRKTAALPLKYSHYRTIKGDGNCGWRALAFNYFEILFRLGDLNFIRHEECRIRSLNNLMNQVGLSDYLYEDFVDATLALLRSTALAIASHHDDSLLLTAFNDPEVSNSIIAHFRCVTSAYMKIHHARYQPFVLDGTVAQYCTTNIDPVAIEIEHIGMKALIDVLIEPAGLAVEIIYLDRSDTDEVNTHRFDAAHPAAPTLRLLYRPGHYDILYKFEDVAPPPQPLPWQTTASAPPVASLPAPDVPPTHLSQSAFCPVFTQNAPMNVHPGSQLRARKWASTIPGLLFVNPPLPSAVYPSATTLSLSPIPFPHIMSPYSVGPLPSPVQWELALRPSIYQFEESQGQLKDDPLAFPNACNKMTRSNTAYFNNPEFQPALYGPVLKAASPSPAFTRASPRRQLPPTSRSKSTRTSAAHPRQEAYRSLRPRYYGPGADSRCALEESITVSPTRGRAVNEPNGPRPPFANNSRNLSKRAIKASLKAARRERRS